MFELRVPLRRQLQIYIIVRKISDEIRPFVALYLDEAHWNKVLFKAMQFSQNQVFKISSLNGYIPASFKDRGLRKVSFCQKFYLVLYP